MIFAPATERSLRIRCLYGAIYLSLILGAITMIAPFLIMVTGSLEPRSDVGETPFFPSYLVDDGALWERYLETKYHGINDYFRMAWNSPDANFRRARTSLPSSGDQKMTALWQSFLREQSPPEALFALAFLRPNALMPSLGAREFTHWLMAKYGSLEAINQVLKTKFRHPSQIETPLIRLDGPSLPRTPLLQKFREFSATQPPERKFAWDCGGYFRTSILPRTVGHEIATYNQRFGTSYTSYEDVPFSATVPVVGREPWVFFVTKLLRPDFVHLTPAGELRREVMGLNKDEYIRSQAQPEELIVVSADTLFAEWAAQRGVPDARIPQPELDRIAFGLEKGFWKGVFVRLNYQFVWDQIAGYGGAIRNTVILVVLSIAGSLLINPLAAYALSRYKMRSSFHILLFCLATIAFPAEVTMIPVFLQLKEMHLLNTFGALILPGLANGFSIFLLKGFFDSLPRELYEAAEIDGAGEWTTFWLITMNLSKPILAVIALETFVHAYGTFFYALILAPDPAMWTLMVKIYQLRLSVAPPVVYASLIITAIPTLIVFVTCQNIILRGLVVPTEK